MVCVTQLENFRLKIFPTVAQHFGVPLLLDSAHE
jgi:hypothetical protein